MQALEIASLFSRQLMNSGTRISDFPEVTVQVSGDFLREARTSDLPPFKFLSSAPMVSAASIGFSNIKTLVNLFWILLAILL